MAFDCMDDCIHLKACRRIQKIGRTHRLMVPRYCTEECSCYISRDEETEYMNSYSVRKYGNECKSYATLGEILDDLEPSETVSYEKS